MKKVKCNSGITLIALVITIIVLIILAGISLNLLLGDNGIIKKAGQAGKESEKASDMEKIKLAATETLIEAKTNKDANLTDIFVSALDQSKIKSIKSNGNVAKIEYGDKEYTVDLKNGNVNNEETVFVKWDGVSISEGLIGEGTEAKPYLIRSAADIRYMSEQMAHSQNITGLNEDETANGCDVAAYISYYKVVNDISLENYNWIPIGRNTETNSSVPFYGVFDGNNHEITKMKIYEDSTSLGFFGYLIKAKVKNLILTDIDIKGNGSLGGIVGSIYPSLNDLPIIEITNCYVSGKITSEMFLDTSIDHYYFRSCYIGGIIGALNGPAIIDGCKVNIDLKGNEEIGGIVGEYRTAPITDENGKNFTSIVRNCTVNGKIQGHRKVGGILGEGEGMNVSGCVSNAEIIDIIKPTPSDPAFDRMESKYFGGIIGYSSAPTIVSNSYNTGSITINAELEACLGGLIGYSYETQISNCHNTGNMTCTNNAKTIGGLFGVFYATGVCRNCYNNGNVILDSTKTIGELGKKLGCLYNGTAEYDLSEFVNNGTTPATNDVGIYR